MIHIADKSQCCGCNACGDACPNQAISFQTDSEGFWYPVVNKSRCIDCGMCEKTCPIVNIEDLRKNGFSQPVCYAGEHKNMEVIFDSTSGGVFSALADIMYRNKGYVGGAVFKEDFSVFHYISADKKDLSNIRGCKYNQSNLEGFYTQVHSLLLKGEKVLVCGTPCQMAALRAFLRKDYENLILVDFVCNGIDSPKAWRKYLDSFEERYNSKVVYCKPRSTEYGWRNATTKVILENGKHVYETRSKSNFAKICLDTRVACRPSCEGCCFNGFPRISDITLGDFWGIEKINASIDKDLGTSLVMINSRKGEDFFEHVKGRIHCIPTPFENMKKTSLTSHFTSSSIKIDRKQFFEDLDRMSFLEIAKKYIAVPKSSVKHKLTRIAKYLILIAKTTQCHPKPLWQLLRYNNFTEILYGNILLPTPYCTIYISKGAKLNKRGVSILGRKSRFKKSHLETRLYVESGGTLNLGPKTYIGYGSDVEVYSGATLTFKADCASNIGLTIICGHHVEFGIGVKIGRHVTIRDNNGAHYMNRQGYKNSQPVIIGDKVWLCESCTIMNGVRIGDGAIVGAKSFVISHVPAHTLASGHPAEIVDEDVYWKY